MGMSTVVVDELGRRSARLGNAWMSILCTGEDGELAALGVLALTMSSYRDVLAWACRCSMVRTGASGGVDGVDGEQRVEVVLQGRTR